MKATLSGSPQALQAHLSAHVSLPPGRHDSCRETRGGAGLSPAGRRRPGAVRACAMPAAGAERPGDGAARGRAGSVPAEGPLAAPRPGGRTPRLLGARAAAGGRRRGGRWGSAGRAALPARLGLSCVLLGGGWMGGDAPGEAAGCPLVAASRLRPAEGGRVGVWPPGSECSRESGARRPAWAYGVRGGRRWVKRRWPSRWATQGFSCAFRTSHGAERAERCAVAALCSSVPAASLCPCAWVRAGKALGGHVYARVSEPERHSVVL